MFIETLCTNPFPVFSTDATDASFATVSPTATEPTGSGIVDMANKGRIVQNGVRLTIIGTGQDDAVLTGLRIYSWEEMPGSNTQKSLWYPTLLCELAAILGSKTGVAGTPFDTTYFFADVITITTGNSNVSVEAVSPSGNEIAHAILDAKGARKLGFYVDLGANMTACNVLAKLL